MRARHAAHSKQNAMTTLNIPVTSSVGSIVANDLRAAAVLTRHGIDFCCKGGRSVEEVCRTKSLDPAELIREIEEALARDTSSPEDFASWTLSRLIDHIESIHHSYVEDRTAVLRQYLHKLCRVHGERHPELFNIAAEFEACAGALASHMKKEELVLFPYIKQLEQADASGTAAPKPYFGTARNPVRMMEEEHDTEGERFRRISQLSFGYAVPSDGCATYSAAMSLLKEFEEDLHTHIHLENNILFPRALRIEEQVRS